MEKINCIISSWDEIYKIAKSTADKIKESGFHPDIIVAIARGGLVPARLLSDFLHVKDLISLKADHWGVTAAKDGQARISYGINSDLRGKKVLVVDDITDTGQSMMLSVEHVNALNPQEVRTAALYHLVDSKFKPDFYGYERDWAWIIFPWNYREDLVNLINKVANKEEREGKSHDEIKADLKSYFNIETEISELKELMEHISYLEKNNKI